MTTKNKTARLIFILLSVYVLFQFAWWAFHIVELHGEIKDLQLEILSNPSARNLALQEYKTRVLMIMGEGAVFACILLLGIWRIATLFRKEQQLLKQEQNFTLAVTHELKTPVATIQLLMETLKTRELPIEKQKQIFENGLGETHRLNQLIENILLTAKFDRQEETHFHHEVDLSSVTRMMAERFLPSPGKGYQLRMNIDEGIQVQGDSTHLGILISNLLENAIKYSPEEAEVYLELTLEKNSPTLRISDQGPGIRPEERKNIYKKFYRIGDENTRDTKGTGLGLYIVQNICKDHKAEISITDNKPTGSTFAIRFPKTNR